MEWLYALIGLVGIGLGAAGGHWFTRKQNAVEVDSLNKQIIGRDEQIHLLKEQVQTNKEITALNARVGDLRENLNSQQKNIGASLRQQTADTRETLDEVKKQLTVVDETGKQLTTQTHFLTNLLSSSKDRGILGEEMLNNLIKQWLAPNEYEFQAPLPSDSTASGLVKVDCLISLPKPPGPIPIDAKFSLKAWQEVGDAENDTERNLARKKLETAIIRQIDSIADNYIVGGHTADFALMFVPSEAVYEEIRGYLDKAVKRSVDKRVFIVSPTTMMIVLTTVQAILHGVKMLDAADAIKQRVDSLTKHVKQLDTDVDKLRGHFDKARGTIGDIQDSTDKIRETGGQIKRIDTGNPPALEDKSN